MDEEAFRFFCAIFTRQNAQLLTQGKLAEMALACLRQSVAEYEGQLWGYVVLPDSLQLVVEFGSEEQYHLAIEAFKTASEAVLCQHIAADFENLLDAITFHHPTYAKPIYLLWQNGYHTQILTSVYALSNKIADLLNKPVELGLVEQIQAWPFSSYRLEDNSEDA